MHTKFLCKVQFQFLNRKKGDIVPEMNLLDCWQLNQQKSHHTSDEKTCHQILSKLFWAHYQQKKTVFICCPYDEISMKMVQFLVDLVERSQLKSITVNKFTKSSSIFHQVIFDGIFLVAKDFYYYTIEGEQSTNEALKFLRWMMVLVSFLPRPLPLKNFCGRYCSYFESITVLGMKTQ